MDSNLAPDGFQLGPIIECGQFGMSRPEDDQRHQLLGELAGTVIVRAIGSQSRQPVGVMVRPDEMVGGRLRGEPDLRDSTR